MWLGSAVLDIFFILSVVTRVYTMSASLVRDGDVSEFEISTLNWLIYISDDGREQVMIDVHDFCTVTLKNLIIRVL